MYDLVGRTLGKYQIIERLHQTAGTEVYKGFQPALNRYVVVNVLKAELIENQAILKRFLDQNDIAANIQHQNLLPMIDYGEESGIYYRVLMYGSEGGWSENKQRLNNSPAIVKMFSDLAAALSHIHSFGYMYLNLRPANIFFGDGKTALLGDFGIVISPGSSSHDPYCSPEVSRQEAVDHRADIYALGILLYELLTGNPPDPDRYVSLKVQRPDLSEEVEKVILKAISEKPEDRFQSVETFQAALEVAFRYSTILSPVLPVTAVEKPKRRNTWWIVLVTVVIVLCLTATVIFAISRAGGDDQSSDIVVPTVEAPPPSEEEVVVVPPGQAPEEDRPDRPNWQLPDIDLPDISEIPFCNSLYPAAGLGLIGIVALKTKRKNNPKDDL